MNGAAPVEPNATKIPSNPNTKKIGISHHFRFSFINSHNSCGKESGSSSAAFSKSVRVSLRVINSLLGGLTMYSMTDENSVTHWRWISFFANTIHTPDPGFGPTSLA